MMADRKPDYQDATKKAKQAPATPKIKAPGFKKTMNEHPMHNMHKGFSGACGGGGEDKY